MLLNYFNITDTPDELKSRRNALVKIHHPDKAKEADKAAKTKIMQQINMEYDYVLKNAQREPVFNGKFKRASRPESKYKTAKAQAQALFHALTQENGIDMDLLFKVLDGLTDVDIVGSLFTLQYGGSIFSYIKKYASTEKQLQSIVARMIQNETFVFIVGTDIVSKLFNFKM